MDGGGEDGGSRALRGAVAKAARANRMAAAVIAATSPLVPPRMQQRLVSSGVGSSVVGWLLLRWAVVCSCCMALTGACPGQQGASKEISATHLRHEPISPPRASAWLHPTALLAMLQLGALQHLRDG